MGLQVCGSVWRCLATAVCHATHPLPCPRHPACLLLQCMAPTYVGDFHLAGADLRRRGLNRIGNMLVPNSNYCKFEDWVVPVLDAMLAEQQAAAKAAAAKGEEAAAHGSPSRVRAAGARRGVVGIGMRMILAAAPLPAADSSHARLLFQTTSIPLSDYCSAICPPALLQMIARLGQEINHPDSIYYWAWKNDIPVFCPALTGGLAGGGIGLRSGGVSGWRKQWLGWGPGC